MTIGRVLATIKGQFSLSQSGYYPCHKDQVSAVLVDARTRMRKSLPKQLDTMMWLTLLLLLGLLGFQRWDAQCSANESRRLQRDMTVAEQILRTHQERLFREARRLACTPQVQAALQAGQASPLATALLAELRSVGAQGVTVFNADGKLLGSAGGEAGLLLKDADLLAAAQRGHDGLGLVPSRQELVLVTAVAVRNPDQSRPAGVVRVARPLDQSLIAEIETATGGRLSATPYESLVPLDRLEPGPQRNDEVARRAEDWLRRREPEAVGNARAVAFQQLHDYQGRPAGLLALTMPRDETAMGVERVLLGLLALLALGLLTATTQSLSVIRHHHHHPPAMQVHAALPQFEPTLGYVSQHLSHHLNNAFAVVVGNLEMLRTRLEPRERLMASEMLRETWRAADLVRRLQHAANRQPLTRFLPVDLDDALTNAKAKVAERRVLPPIEGEGFAELVAAGWSGDIVEMLVAILENAAAAAGPEGHLRIEGEAVGARLKLTISDNGPGMDAETRAHAAELFFTTKGPQSQGLGLCVVDSVVRRHSGQWRIVSEPGQGCTIEVHLPAWEPIALHSV